MKQLLAILAFTFLAMIPLRAHVEDAQATYDAMVVMKVADLDDAAVAALARQLGRQQETSLEYSCTWSGVLVLKLSGIGVRERADVIMLARRQLTQAGIEKAMEVLHVHVETRGTGKC